MWAPISPQAGCRFFRKAGPESPQISAYFSAKGYQSTAGLVHDSVQESGVPFLRDRLAAAAAGMARVPNARSRVPFLRQRRGSCDATRAGTKSPQGSDLVRQISFSVPDPTRYAAAMNGSGGVMAEGNWLTRSRASCPGGEIDEPLTVLSNARRRSTDSARRSLPAWAAAQSDEQPQL